MANGMTKRQETPPPPCERCNLPHIYLRGLCPEDGPEARAKFERAADGWAVYEKRQRERRARGLA